MGAKMESKSELKRSDINMCFFDSRAGGSFIFDVAGGSKIYENSMEKRLQDKTSSSDPKYREKAPNIGPRWGPKSLLDGLKSMLKTGSKTSVKNVMQVDAGRRK